MKKIIYALAIASLSAMACTGGNNYKITGVVKGATDGDSVFIQNRVNREFIKIASAVIKNGNFIFEGRQDSAVNRYFYYAKGEKKYRTDFFLENGNIYASLAEDSIVGTSSNDIYHAFKSKMNVINKKESDIYASMQSASLTDEQKKAKEAEMNELDKKMMATISESIDENISNVVGIHLLKSFSYYLDYEQLEKVLAKVPAKFQKNPDIVQMKELVKTAKVTAVGQKFTDFTMLTPEGKTTKLSNFAGKGKYVLVDFWASWCGPCRKEMPNLVKLYAQFKDKGFEIVGVSLDKSKKNWTDAISALNISWPQMSDLKYWDCEGAKLYTVRSIPHTVLIDKDGKIIARGLTGEDLHNKLAELLK